jgi:hypothetical protein
VGGWRGRDVVGPVGAVGAGESPTHFGLVAALFGFVFRAGVAKFLVEGDCALTELEDQAEVGVVGSFFGSKPALDAKEDDPGEEAVDVFRRGESASRCGEFGGGEFFGWGLVAQAEWGIGGGGRGSAAAARGRGVNAAGERIK